MGLMRLVCVVKMASCIPTGARTVFELEGLAYPLEPSHFPQTLCTEASPTSTFAFYGGGEHLASAISVVLANLASSPLLDLGYWRLNCQPQKKTIHTLDCFFFIACAKESKTINECKGGGVVDCTRGGETRGAQLITNM